MFLSYLNLVPSFIQSHRHCAHKWLDSRRRLIIRGSKSTSNVLIIENLQSNRSPHTCKHTTPPISPNLHFKREIFFQIFYDHHQEGQLDAKCWFPVASHRPIDVLLLVFARQLKTMFLGRTRRTSDERRAEKKM